MPKGDLLEPTHAHGGSRRRVVVRTAGLVLLAAALAACQGSRLRTQWLQTLAPQTLACIHPLAIYGSADEAEVSCHSGVCELTGVIRWTGRLSKAPYVTRVKLVVEGAGANVVVLEDSSPIDAQDDCRVLIPQS